jgi:hypothetical protein
MDSLYVSVDLPPTPTSVVDEEDVLPTTPRSTNRKAMRISPQEAEPVPCPHLGNLAHTYPDVIISRHLGGAPSWFLTLADSTWMYIRYCPFCGESLVKP